MTTVEVLRAARAKIDTPEKWAQGPDLDRPVGRRCAAVALIEAADSEAVELACERIIERITGRNIVVWNDDPATDHAAVLAVFDMAIDEECVSC